MHGAGLLVAAQSALPPCRIPFGGGSDEPVNLTTLCVSHHLHGVHGSDEGRLIVRGEAPDRLVWTLGGRESGPPVMVFEGERRTYSSKRVP